MPSLQISTSTSDTFIAVEIYSDILEVQQPDDSGVSAQ